MLATACNGGGAEGTTSTSSTSSSSSTQSSGSTTDYKDEAVEAARAWIEDDAGRSTTKNATAEQAAKRRQGDAALKKAGITTTGHDSVVSTEIDKSLTNPTDVVINVCVTTDQKLMKDGKNVRTDAKGKAIKPGDRLLQTISMHRDVGAEDWLVGDVQVRERSC